MESNAVMCRKGWFANVLLGRFAEERLVRRPELRVEVPEDEVDEPKDVERRCTRDSTTGGVHREMDRRMATTRRSRVMVEAYW